jgi:perosamine synthetase
MMIGLPALEKMITRADATLRDAMVVIENNAQGLCFVVEGGTVIGVLSDGDIRRALMEGAQVDKSVVEVMQRNFVSLLVNTPLEQIQAQLNDRIRIIPIVDNGGQLVDYACAQRYHQVPLTQPVLDGNELEYVTDCIRTGWISSQGKYVRQFEESFRKYVGSPHALVVSNGTVALHLALVALGIGPGDEVIVPDLTFAAPVNAVLYVGATPVLVDIDQHTLTMNMDAAERAVTARTRAIIPVHLYGHPADMGRVMALARQHDLVVVEDCAEALGSMCQGIHVGNHGNAAIFSFFGNKTITTGEGGMLLFNDAAIYERARMLRDHGMSKERRYWHEQVGYNYRMTNIQAAIGVAQMERIEEFVIQKRWNADQYRLRLSDVPGLQLIGEVGDVINSYWFYTVVLPASYTSKRDEIIGMMLKNGVEVRPVFYPMHRMPPYAPFVLKGQTFQVSDSIADLGISLPSGVTMTEVDIEKVCHVLIHALAHSHEDEMSVE